MKSLHLLSLSVYLLSLFSSFTSASLLRPHIQLDQHRVRRAGSQVRGGRELAVRDGPEKKQLGKRSEVTAGRATWYAVGLGACGGTNVASDFVIAISFEQYGDTGAVSPLCWQTVSISYGGKSTKAQIVDACEACPSYTGIDMSEGLFSYFADTSVGVIYVNWGIGGDDDSSSSSSSSSTKVAATTTKHTSSTWSSTYTPPSSTYTPPTTTYTPSSTSYSSTVTTSSVSAVAAALATSTVTSPLVKNATSSSSGVSSSSAIAVAASATASSNPSASVGGTLDRIAQLVIALGEVAASAAKDAVPVSS